MDVETDSQLQVATPLRAPVGPSHYIPPRALFSKSHSQAGMKGKLPTGALD